MEQGMRMFDFDADGDEKVKRLQPTKETIRHLFALSGNICAHPNCGRNLILPDGTYVGQICHIEAAEDGGERFNPRMSNEERRSPANLMLMCADHHVITNDVIEYPVERLQQMKTDHERLFSGADRLILGEIRDWDRTQSLIVPSNFIRFYDFIEWPDQYRPEPVFEFQARERLQMLAQAPLSVRAFLELVCKGIVRQRDRIKGDSQFHVEFDNILWVDVRDGSRMTDKRMSELVALLGSYRLGGIFEGDRTVDHEIYVRSVEDVPFFQEVIRFARAYNIPTEVFFNDLNFSSLDA